MTCVNATAAVMLVVCVIGATKGTSGPFVTARPSCDQHTLKQGCSVGAFAVEHVRRQDGFDGVPDRVPKVDEVAQTCLALVEGDNVRFDKDTARDDLEKQVLSMRARRLMPADVRVLGGR